MARDGEEESVTMTGEKAVRNGKGERSSSVVKKVVSRGEDRMEVDGDSNGSKDGGLMRMEIDEQQDSSSDKEMITVATNGVGSEDDDDPGRLEIIELPNGDEMGEGNMDDSFSESEQGPFLTVVDISTLTERDEGGSSNEKTGDAEADEESEEENGVGMIRIRDIGSLREQDASDDEVVEIIPVPTNAPFVRMNSVSEVEVGLEMTCEDDLSIRPRRKEAAKDRRVKYHVTRHKVEALKVMLKAIQRRGLPGVKVQHGAKPSASASAQTPAPAAPQVSQPSQMNVIQIQRPVVSNSGPMPSGYVRNNPVQITTPVTIVASRVLPQAGFTTNTLTAQPTSPRQTTRPHILASGGTGNQPQLSQVRPTTFPNQITQVVYDVASGGLMMCPPPAPKTPATAVTASQQVANSRRTPWTQASAEADLIEAIKGAQRQMNNMINNNPTPTRVVTNTTPMLTRVVSNPAPPRVVSVPNPTLTRVLSNSGPTRVEPNPTPTRVTPNPAPTRVEPNPTPTRVAPNPTPVRVTPNPTPGRVTPNPTPGRVTPNPTPGRVTPNPTQARVEPIPTPTRVTPNPVPTRVEPTPTPAKVTPNPAPTRVEPIPTPTRVTPNPAPTRVEPIPTPAKVTPTKVEPAPTLTRVTSNPMSTRAMSNAVGPGGPPVPLSFYTGLSPIKMAPGSLQQTPPVIAPVVVQTPVPAATAISSSSAEPVRRPPILPKCTSIQNVTKPVPDGTAQPSTVKSAPPPFSTVTKSSAPATVTKPTPIYQPPSTAAPVSASFRKADTTTVQESDFNRGEKVSGRTYPSLVVTVKPCLQDKLSKGQSNTMRAELDAKVKTILMQPPEKFCEWLIQQGLLKLDIKCPSHNDIYKLAMYSDTDNHPCSGGYVFTVDCCPDKQLPVFQGSIFEASIYPPGTTMKLIYHWACQTPSANVLQWVKVNSHYLKNFYTLLRSVCVASIHELLPTVGGKGKYIEVGIVTLGTLPGDEDPSDDPEEPSKLEVFGVFDPSAKIIRMRLIICNNLEDPDLAKRDRINQIIAPLSKWVNKDSFLLIDNALDKTMVERLGFRHVSQVEIPEGVPTKTTIPTNVNVMNYLKRVLPKMFQNTLQVLSKSLIQQFLDELCWRELWGPHPMRAFDMMVDHIVDMTKAEMGELLIPRLNRISLNPFAEWAYSKGLPPPSGIECLPDSIRAQPLSELVANSKDASISNLVSSYMTKARTNSSSSTKTVDSTGTSSRDVVPAKVTPPKAGKRKNEGDTKALDLTQYMIESPKTHTLQAYYYVYLPSTVECYKMEFPANVKCPLCSKMLKSSRDTMHHIVSHVLSSGRLSSNQHSCRYCLKEVQSQQLLDQHVANTHKRLDEVNICRICVEKFPSEHLLVMHMWKRHTQCEAPYRCEICEYRSSFHYDLVDHFYKEHGLSDTVQCPMCLKTMPARSITCLRNVVSHFQNHVLKKGKKCQDCCLMFSSESECRVHQVNDNAHVSRNNKNFAQHEVDDTPIRMPKPPTIDKNAIPSPPAKKPKNRRSSGSGAKQTVTAPPPPPLPGGANLQTLNTGFAVPLNPSDRFMITTFKMKITDVDKEPAMACWECFKPINIVGHYRGTMKCSRCRFETCCSFTIQQHIKTHEANNVANRTAVRAKLIESIKADLTSDALECAGCNFVSASTRRLACHLVGSGHKVALPRNKEDRDD